MVLDKSLRHNRKRSKSPICVTKFGVPKNLSVVGIHPVSAQDGLEIQRVSHRTSTKTACMRHICSNPFDAKNGFINIAFYPFNSVSWSKNNIKTTKLFSKNPWMRSQEKTLPRGSWRVNWSVNFVSANPLIISEKNKIREGAMFGAPCK